MDGVFPAEPWEELPRRTKAEALRREEGGRGVIEVGLNPQAHLTCVFVYLSGSGVDRDQANFLVTLVCGCSTGENILYRVYFDLTSTLILLL